MDTFTPSPPHPYHYTLTSTPLPLHPYLYTLTSTPLPLHPHLYTLILITTMDPKWAKKVSRLGDRVNTKNATQNDLEEYVATKIYLYNYENFIDYSL